MYLEDQKNLYLRLIEFIEIRRLLFVLIEH